MRKQSSSAKDRLNRVTLNEIPPVTSRLQIEKFIVDMISFFQQENDIVILDLPPSPEYFSILSEVDYTPTEDESRNISTYVKKGKKSMFQYLASHPDLCRVAVKQIPWSHFKSNKRKNFYYQLLQIAFYADSLDLYKLTIVDTNSPPTKNSRKNHAVPLLQFIENTGRIPGLYIDPNYNSASFEHTLDYIPTATAFAASPTELFVGKEGGFIRTISLNSTSKIYPHYCLFRPSVSNEAYSLAWIKGYLWILTNSTIYQVNTLISKVWTFVNNKPKDLVPPMCTDGHFFYCLRVKNRTPEIHIFSFNGTDFIHERHIKLNYQIALQVEHKVIFATDGGLMTFLIPKGKESVFRIFSLATGKWLYDRAADSTISQTICWCTRPFSNENVIITPKNILFYSKQLQIPRWLLGLPWPKSNSSNAIVNALELACFHGVNFFKTGPYDEIGPLLNHFISTNNEVGFRLVSMILLRSQIENIKPILQIIVDYYQRCDSNPIMQRFLCFIFLACSNESTASVKPNIFSMYLEKDNTDLDFVFLYPKGFNFKYPSLSEAAVKKLIVYVAERWNDFPIEASYIILNFLEDYCTVMMRKDMHDSILEPISAIFRVISKSVSLIFKNKMNAEMFCKSPQFTAWGFLLKIIMKNSNSWPRYAHILVKMLKLGFASQETEQENCQQIKDMMNKTLYLLLEILLRSPLKLYEVEYESIEDFYHHHSHPMNMQYNPIDNSILNTLNKAYDISTPDEYAEYFFKVRRSIVFDYACDPRVINELKLKSLSAKGLLEYLSYNKEKALDKKILFPIQDPNLLHWFFAEFSKVYNHLTIEQNIILSLFFIKFHKKLNKYSSKNILDKETWDLKSHFLFPFMFSPILLNQMDVHIPSHSIKSLDSDILEFSFDTIVSVFEKVDKKDHFLKPILKYLPPSTDKPNYSHFASIETEPKRFKSIFLWLIAAKCGYDIDYANYSEAFKIYIWSGSPRIVEAAMRGVVIAETQKNTNLTGFFDFIISLIKNYIYRLRNFFLLQFDPSDSIISLFIIIEYLKVMFNSKASFFRNYLENVAKKCKPSKAVAIFAILNNYLETVRKGVKIHFYSDNLIEVDGIVNDYYGNVVCVDGVQYDLSSCTKIWCKCSEKVDLSKNVNLKVYSNLFKNTEYIEGKEDYLNVFKYASMITFLKHKKFYKLLSRHIKHNFTQLPVYHSFEPEMVFAEFFLFLSYKTRLTEFSKFSFVNINEQKIENPVSPVIQNFLLSCKAPNNPLQSTTNTNEDNNSENIDVLNDNENDIEGMLMTMEEEGKFVSSPIHHLCQMKITFFLYPSEPHKQKPSLSITVYGISRTSSLILKSDPINVSSSASDSVVVEILFNPSSSTFSTYIDKELESETAISPSINCLFMTIHLLPSSLINYKVSYDKDIKEIDEFPKCFNLKKSNVQLMSVADSLDSLPLSESSIYNEFCFKEASSYLVNCFSQLIKMQILHMSNCNQKSKKDKDDEKKSKKKRRKNQESGSASDIDAVHKKEKLKKRKEDSENEDDDDSENDKKDKRRNKKEESDNESDDKENEDEEKSENNSNKENDDDDKDKKKKRSKDKYKMKPIFLMHVLAMSNSFPNDETLDFTKLRKTSLFHNLGHDSNSFIREFITNKSDEINLSKYVRAVDHLIKPYTKSLASTSNKSAFFIKSSESFMVSNCYIFSESQAPQNVGFANEVFETNKAVAVIPSSNFHGTIIDCLLYIRHLIALFVLKGNYDFTPIHELIEKMTKKHETTLKPLFEPLLEMMSLLAPSPKKMNIASFLIKESNIYKHKDISSFLDEFLPSFAPSLISPQTHLLTLPAQLYLPDADLIYITVNTKSGKSRELIVKPTPKQKEQHKNMNSPSTPIPTLKEKQNLLIPVPRGNVTPPLRNSSSMHITNKTSHASKSSISYFSSFYDKGDKKDRIERSENETRKEKKEKKDKRNKKEKEKSEKSDIDNDYEKSDNSENANDKSDKKEKNHRKSKKEKKSKRERSNKSDISENSESTYNNDIETTANNNNNDEDGDDFDENDIIHITTDDGSYKLIKYNNFKVKSLSHSDPIDEIEITVYPIDLSIIPKNLDNWKPNYSHQILCSLQKGCELTEELYNLMPLSTIFPFQIASFVLSVIRNGRSSLFTFLSHQITSEGHKESRFSLPQQENSALMSMVMTTQPVISPQPQFNSLLMYRINTTGNINSNENIVKGSINNLTNMNNNNTSSNGSNNAIGGSINSMYNSMCGTLSELSPNGELASMMEAIYDDGFENSPLYSNYCLKVTEKEKQSWQRIFYLRENKLSLQANLDPDWIRISPEYAQYPVTIKILKQQLEKNIKYTKSSKHVAEWLINYIQVMPNFVVLMFIDFAIGKWGTRALQCDPPNEIFVYHTSRVAVIETIQEEHLIIIGQFNSEDDFRNKFMRTIQDYNDYLYNLPNVEI